MKSIFRIVSGCIGFLFIAVCCFVLAFRPVTGVHAAEEPIMSENFDSGSLGAFTSFPNDYIHKSNLPAYPVWSEEKINGTASAMLEYAADSEQFWHKMMTASVPFAAGTYTVAFQYQPVSFASGAFGTLKIGHAEDDNDTRGVGFDAQGIVQTHLINVKDAKAEKKGNIYQVYFTVEADAAHNNLQFSASGGAKFIVDDVAVYAGEIVPQFPENVLRDPDRTVVSNSNFENNNDESWTTLNEQHGESYLGGEIISDTSKKLNGYYSKVLYSSNLWATSFITNDSTMFETNTVYTVAFRYRAFEKEGYPNNENTLVIFGLREAASASLQKFRCISLAGDPVFYRYENGEKYAFISDIIQLTVDKHDGYNDVQVVFKTDSANNYIFSIGVYGCGSILLDDVRLIKGLGADELPEPEARDMSDYPSVIFAGARPESGYVSKQLDLPRAQTTNCPGDPRIEIVQPDKSIVTVDYAERTFVPTQDGVHKVVYYARNAAGYESYIYFNMTIKPRPNKPTITVDEKYLNELNGYTNEIVLLPFPEMTDDEDGNVSIEVNGPDGFYASQRQFLATKEGTYTVKYTATNGLNESTDFTFSLQITARPTEEDFVSEDKGDDSHDATGCSSAASVSALLFAVPAVAAAAIGLRRKNKQ